MGVKRPTWMAGFMGAYRETGLIAPSARTVGINRDTVYKFLERNPDHPLHDEMAAAKKDVQEGAELVMIHRAKVGVSHPVYYQGKLVGTYNEPSDQLLMFWLKSLDPDKYRDRHAIDVSGTVVTESQADRDLAEMVAFFERAAGRSQGQGDPAGERQGPEPALGE